VTDSGIIVALIGVASTLAVALIALWRFRRKDRADATAVEDGTISGRFKDADTLMRYIDSRVEAKTADLEAEVGTLKQVQDAFRAWVASMWLWDQRGRFGAIPMPDGEILTRIGLGHFADDWPTEPTNSEPPAGGFSRS
jgi:hypothetical protein